MKRSILESVATVEVENDRISSATFIRTSTACSEKRSPFGVPATQVSAGDSVPSCCAQLPVNPGFPNCSHRAFPSRGPAALSIALLPCKSNEVIRSQMHSGASNNISLQYQALKSQSWGSAGMLQSSSVRMFRFQSTTSRDTVCVSHMFRSNHSRGLSSKEGLPVLRGVSRPHQFRAERKRSG